MKVNYLIDDGARAYKAQPVSHFSNDGHDKGKLVIIGIVCCDLKLCKIYCNTDTYFFTSTVVNASTKR